MRKLFNIIKMLLLSGLLLVACQAPTGVALAENASPPKASTQAPAQEKNQPPVTYGQAYSSPEEVGAYLLTYEELPPNYLTKQEAKALGWRAEAGNLWEVTEQMSIGGDHFGNFEGQLPEGHYREADVNYQGGFRGPERLIYSSDFSLYYTPDHYQHFIPWDEFIKEQEDNHD